LPFPPHPVAESRPLSPDLTGGIVDQRDLPAYVAEFIGTFFLVFFIAPPEVGGIVRRALCPRRAARQAQ
jgi:hypothetical protein